MAIYSGFSHQKWWFSIAMLVHQRVRHMVIAQSLDGPISAGSIPQIFFGQNAEIIFYPPAVLVLLK